MTYKERERIVNSINTGDDRDSLVIDLYDRLNYTIERVNKLGKKLLMAKLAVVFFLVDIFVTCCLRR